MGHNYCQVQNPRKYEGLVNLLHECISLSNLTVPGASMDAFFSPCFFIRLYNGQSKENLNHVELNSSILCARAVPTHEAFLFVFRV